MEQSDNVLQIKEQPKLCVNCKHFRPNSSFMNFLSILFGQGETKFRFARCARFPLEPSIANKGVNLLSGERVPKELSFHEMSFASTSRKYDTVCGLEGKYFEPVER